MFWGKHREVKTFPFPIDKEVANIDKDGNENGNGHWWSKIYGKSFIKSCWLSLRKNTHIKCKDCDCFLEYESDQNNLIRYKCLFCNKYYSNKINGELKMWFKNTFKFSNNDINKSFCC